VPALKYRLYPLSTDRKEGNAVPIYLRFAHERGDARKKELREKPPEWNKMPLDKLPMAEVKKFLDSFHYNLKQLDLGARRKTADWNYTLDAGNPIGILLPDAQEMRIHAPILVLKARLEIVEGRIGDALRTLETGFSFSRQIGEGPFLINSLVGIGCASQFADCVREMIEQPRTPNLYWALAVIPRPLIDLRKANEVEQGMVERQFPDLEDLERPRSAEGWDQALVNVRKEMDRLRKLVGNAKPTKPGNAVTDPGSKSPDLPAARKYLVEVAGMKAAAVEAMPASEALLRYMSSFFHEFRDEVFKVGYLPPSSIRRKALVDDAERRIKDVPDTDAGLLTRWLLPAVHKVQLRGVLVQRLLAILQAIEALRMHAAAHNGTLPDKLDDVKVVPVPDDPGTGRPFEYQRDGGTATLISRMPGEPPGQTAIRYRVTLRK
jgi:hypothetical protein